MYSTRLAADAKLVEILSQIVKLFSGGWEDSRGAQRGFPKHDVVSMGIDISARGPLIEFLYEDHPIRLSVKYYASENTSLPSMR